MRIGSESGPLRGPVLLALLLGGCVRSAASGDAEAPATEADPSGAIPIVNANNYRFDGELDVPRFPLRALADVGVSWAGATEDVQCQALDPVGDIDNVSLLTFPHLSEAEVETGLAHDSLQQADSAVYLSWPPGSATDLHLSDLTFFGTPADIDQQFKEGTGQWLLLFATGETVGVGTRLLALLTPDDDETTTSVSLEPQCGTLDYEVDLEALVPVPVLRDGPWLLDWSRLTVNGMRNPFFPTKVSEVTVAWFAERTVPELEADFLDLPSLADRRWSMRHAFGTGDDLAQLTDVNDGSAFPGFTAEGTWVLALLCETCAVPAPLLLTVVAPE